MSNQSRTQPGGGVVERLIGDGARVASRIGILCLALSWMVSASAAVAAEVVEVRVGRHAEFTRIVFELDRAAGYRIERASPSPGVSELVISLEATSIPRRIRSSKSLIEQVEIEPSGLRSVARVRLAKGGLRLKEMILASPPRIVLDVLSDEPIARDTPPTTPPTKMATKTATTISPAKTAKTATPPPPLERRSAAAPSPTGVKPGDAAMAAAPAESAKFVAPIDSMARSESVDKTDGKVGAASSASASSASASNASASHGAVSNAAALDAAAAAAVANANAAAKAEAGSGIDSEEPSGAAKILREREEALARAAREPSTSTRVEPPATKPDARPMVAKTTAQDEGGGWMTWALAGGGAVVLLLGGFLIWRRRQGGEEIGFVGADAPQDDAPIEFGRTPTSAAAENPFAGLLGDDDEQMTLGAPGGTKPSPRVATEAGGDSFAFGDAGEGEEEKEVEEMEMISRDAVNESLGGMPSAMGGMSDEFQQMMREMNRRVEALEGRIDELVDARDRLERQVAAQTEELRVQRAAIARTQRAVRNLARPEDEPEATEPALREPNPPGGV